jgi:hypothetical protein
LVLVLKLKTNCAIFMPIVKVFALAWYLIWKFINLPWPNW